MARTSTLGRSVSLSVTLAPTPDRSGAAVLVLSIESAREALRSALEGCRKKPKHQRVHALRVATRRLQSALELASSVGAKSDSRLQHQLGELLPTLSPLRDTHVARRAVERLAAGTPGVGRLRKLFVERERRLERQVVARLVAFDLPDFEQEVSVVTSRLLELCALDGSRPAVAAALRGALAERHLDAERRRRRASAEHPRSLHRLRLTLKHYRYGLDALGAVLPREGQQASRALALMQEQLGNAHDALVLAEKARSWAKKRRKLLGLAQALRQTSRDAQVAGAKVAAQASLSWPFAEKEATPESLR